ncbi:unnamed protein product [Sphenostylis stenocarpa]|uniref:Uncharacterized protein n=1 Tax=Sphenostylis stenocarpa TaxID=92480 RepID=A0AA86RWR2_9FABA|nr:unnamed protein product [Sphenostylis stenocarpa]
MDRIELSIEKEIGGMNSRLQKHYAELKEKIERLEEETRKIKETRRFNNSLIEKERELQKTKEQDPYSQYTIQNISSDDSIPSSDEESVESFEENTETEEAEVNHTFMANDTEQPFAERTRLHNQEVNTPHPTNNMSLQNHQISPKQNWFNPDTPFLNIFAILMGEEFTEEDQWPYFAHPESHELWTQNQVRIWSTFPRLKIFTQQDQPSFYQSELIIELHRLNGTFSEMINKNSTCSHLKPLDIICKPDGDSGPFHDQEERVMPLVNIQGSKQIHMESANIEGQIIMMKEDNDEDLMMDTEDSDSDDPNLSPSPTTPITTVHLTGFKKFHGVAENPTETIVNNLTEYMNEKGLPNGLVIESCSILETAGEGALETLYQRLQSTLLAKDTES